MERDPGVDRVGRRAWILTSGAGIGTLLSGCMGDGEPPNRDDPLGPEQITPEEVNLEVEVRDNDASQDTDGRTPSETVVAFYEALLAGEPDRVDALVHRDSPRRPIESERNDELLGYIDALSAAETVRELDELAAVDVTVNARGVDSIMAYHMRRDDGRWTLWTIHSGVDAGVAPIAAIVAKFDEQAVHFDHLTGDPLPVEDLSVAAVEADGTDRSFSLPGGAERFTWNSTAIGETFEPGETLVIEIDDYDAFLGGEVGLIHGTGPNPVVFPRPLAEVPEQ